MRCLALLALASGCDAFFGITAVGTADPADGSVVTSRWCTDSAQQGAPFCADFDSSDALGAFNQLDQAKPFASYMVDTTAPLTRPNAALLRAAHDPAYASPDARLGRSLTALPSHVVLELDIDLAARDLGRAKVFSLYWPPLVVWLSTDGELVGYVEGGMYSTLLDVANLATGSWTHVRLEIDAALGSYKLAVTNAVEGTSEMVTTTNATFATTGTSARLEVGPHDPSVPPAEGWTIRYDNVIVR